MTRTKLILDSFDMRMKLDSYDMEMAVASISSNKNFHDDNIGTNECIIVDRSGGDVIC